MSSQSQKFDPDNPAKPKLCPKCQEKGIKSKVKMRRLFPDSEKVLLCKHDLCTWPYTLEEMKALLQRSSQPLGNPKAQSTPIRTPSRRKRPAEAVSGRDEASGSPEVLKAKRERTEEEPALPAHPAQCQQPQPTPEVFLSTGVSASEEVSGGEEVRQEEEEEIKFEERNRSKMKSYGGRKTMGNPRKKEEECRHQEEIQKAREALENREESIDCDLSPSCPNPEKTLSVGGTEKKYGGSQPRKLVSLPAPPPRLGRDNQRRLDCSPTREEDVTIQPDMTDLGRKRETPGRKCKAAPGDENRNKPRCYFSWKGEQIGLEEILELEEFYQNLASCNQHSVEIILKAEPKNSSISREKNFFFEVYLKYQLIIEMITNASTTTLMSLLSFHHLDNENFKKLILKEKKEEEEGFPPGSPSVSSQSSPVSSGIPEPSASSAAAASVSLEASGEEEPLDLSLPTRERARLGLGLDQAEGLRKIQKVSTEEEGERNHEKEAVGKLKERKKKEVKGKGKPKKVKVEVKKVKKEIKEKPKTTRKVGLADKEENSTATSNGSKNDEDKREKNKEEIGKSVFFSMEEEPQEVKEIIPPVPELPELCLSESATTITVPDESLWKDLESVSDVQTAPGDLNIDLLFNL